VVARSPRLAAALLALLVWTSARASAQTLTVEATGDALRIRAPGFSFLKGEPLARLKDGRSVRVELTAMALPSPGRPAAVTTRRIFALSYDLWEERFAVTTVGARAQSASHLALAAAEAWCVDQVAIPLGALDRDVPFYVRLEYRILDGDSGSDSADPFYTLQALIDVLSRRGKKTDAAPHAIEGGPFRTPRVSSSAR
jgi:hypothetical protein